MSQRDIAEQVKELYGGDLSGAGNEDQRKDHAEVTKPGRTVRWSRYPPVFAGRHSLAKVREDRRYVRCCR
ncbi:MAG: hypothetical protein ACLU38_07365 [Dysosmobacter sp.]